MHVGASLSRVHEETRADFEATLVDMDGGDDHVHLLVEYPPISSRLRKSEPFRPELSHRTREHKVNSLKGVSGCLLRKI